MQIRNQKGNSHSLLIFSQMSFLHSHSHCIIALVLSLIITYLPLHSSFHVKTYTQNAPSKNLQSQGTCDLFQGSWVFDNAHPLYDALKCPFIDAGLNCLKNGRNDTNYLHYRWKPDGCDLIRFNGKDFLERYRGKKIMFVGDSLSSNQWQSLACMLQAGVPNSTYNLDRGKALTNLSFPDYGVSVMLLKNGFLVDLVVEKVGKVLKLDSISRSGQWNGNDVLIFNSYHWWIHTGTSQTWDYFQIGDQLSKDMDHMDAYKIALTTWGKWVDSNVDPSKTRVFFQGISATHYHGVEWNESSVKDCSGQTKPIEGSAFPGKRYPGEAIVKSVLSNMTKPVHLLAIALLTQLRKDGHPSKYANGPLDCSHWCVAGVPDAWNELLYATLVQM